MREDGQNSQGDPYGYFDGEFEFARKNKSNGSEDIVTDHLGSVRQVVNTSTGAVVERIEYDEFGNVLYDSNPGFTPFGFVGGVYNSETKLVRFGARDYDASTGRWTTKDPIDFDGKSLNLFAYGNCDPVNSRDPQGKITAEQALEFSTLQTYNGMVQMILGFLCMAEGAQAISASFGNANPYGGVTQFSVGTAAFGLGIYHIGEGLLTIIEAQKIPGSILTRSEAEMKRAIARISGGTAWLETHRY